MLSWKLIEVQEQTLRHVARDLHDHFGQILTAIGVMLGRAGQKAADTDPVFVQDVRAAKRIVEDTLQSVRDESQIFRPAILDDFGLQQTLEWFAEQFSRQTGVQVHYGGKLADGLFPPEAAIHVYRIVQEALSNVARHSGAREAWVTLGEKENQLDLEIRDNGSGFEARPDMKRAAGQGIGLMGMRERAEHLQGSFAIRSAPHKGTTVSVRVPLHRPVGTFPSRGDQLNRGSHRNGQENSRFAGRGSHPGAAGIPAHAGRRSQGDGGGRSPHGPRSHRAVQDPEAGSGGDGSFHARTRRDWRPRRKS